MADEVDDCLLRSVSVAERSVAALGLVLDRIPSDLPIAALTRSATALNRAAQSLAECAVGSNSAELAVAVAQFTAQARKIDEILQVILAARASILRCRHWIFPQAQPSTTPATVDAVSRQRHDQRKVSADDWGARMLASLPRWRVGQVTGVYLNEDGGAHSIISGADESGLHDRIHEFLVQRQLLPPWMTKHILRHGQRMIITDPTGSYEFEGVQPE